MTINELLLSKIPEIKDFFEQETSWQDGIKTGSHIVFEDILSKFVVDNQDNNWWKILLGVILLILLIVILAPVLPYIIRGLLWLILLPFRIIGAIFKAVKNKRKDKT